MAKFTAQIKIDIDETWLGMGDFEHADDASSILVKMMAIQSGIRAGQVVDRQQSKIVASYQNPYFNIGIVSS